MLKKVKISFLSVFICISAVAQYKKFSFQQPKMGSPFNIVIYSTDSVLAAEAAKQGFNLIDTLNEIYSDYLPNSELNRLCAKSGSKQWVKVSEPLYTILQKSYDAAAKSFGSFDITMSPVIRLWRAARLEKRLPDKDRLTEARKRVGYKFIEFDAVNRRVRLKKAGMQLDLGGIGKGETAQRVIDRLGSIGCPFSLIDAGGDIVAGDVPPEVAGWRVAINMPESEELMDQQLLLRKNAVTTSGDLYQYIELNGIRYSHIINPYTGWALTNSRNVTVISTNGTNADWLTKACSILPIDEALKLLAGFPATEVQIAVIENNKPKFYRSPGFASYFRQE